MLVRIDASRTCPEPFVISTGGADTLLAARIQHLLQAVLTTDDEKQKEAAEAEAKDIFTKRGRPTIAAVGDEPAYECVLLTCSPGPAEFRKQVLRKAAEEAKRHEVPGDAASYCAAHLRQETVKAEAKKQALSSPALGEQIKRLFKADQAVREKQGFDIAKTEQANRERAAVLEAIFAKYGVPTFRMAGPQAAADFVTMIQHQSPEFRRKVLPKLKANVDGGHALNCMLSWWWPCRRTFVRPHPRRSKEITAPTG